MLGIHAEEIQRVDFFTSHEGLLLDYEEAQTEGDHAGPPLQSLDALSLDRHANRGRR